MWMRSCTGSARRIWGILKKSDSWVEKLSLDEKGQLSGLTEARRICLLQALNEMGCRWKSQNIKNVYLSPYVEEPLNSKVIKSFVPELRSRMCFSCFEIPMFYVYIYIWTAYVRFTHIHIHVWLWYTSHEHLRLLFTSQTRSVRSKAWAETSVTSSR